MKTFRETAEERRSVRDFSGEHIPDEVIGQILEIAAYALSSWGGHPVEYIVIRDRETMKKLAACKAMGAGPLAYGDAAIVPVIDSRNLELWIEDASVASAYILLAAESLGAGACWIHMRGRSGHTGTSEEDIRDLLGIPSYYHVLNAVSLGMKKKDLPARQIRPKVHRERF